MASLRAIGPTRAEDVVNSLVDYPEIWVWLLAVVSCVIPTRVNSLVDYPDIWVWLLAVHGEFC